jgi:ferrous iron transport protein B
VTRDLPDVVTRRVALVGAPNCGKTALFNRLTGSRQKVANYPGVTVERKEGAFFNASRHLLYRVIDLPGTYSLVPTSLDEAITRDVVTGRLRSETPPELIICVLDSTNLRLSLRLTLELARLQIPMIVALNMSDLAQRRGFTLDRAALARELGVPVVDTVAVRAGGEAALLAALDTLELSAPRESFTIAPVSDAELTATQREVRRILAAAGYVEPLRDRALARLDAIVMHPVAGPVLLCVLLGGSSLGPRGTARAQAGVSRKHRARCAPRA